MEEENIKETRPQAASFFSALMSWVPPALVCVVFSVIVCHYVLGVGTYISPDNGECFCVVNKFAPSMQIGRSSSVVASTPDGNLLLNVVGLPGDTISIADARLFRNHDVNAESGSAVATYHLNARTPYATMRRLREMGQTIDSSSFVLKILERDKLRDVAFYTHVKPAPNMDDERMFPWNVVFQWNAYQWGPMRLPHKGDRIYLTFANVGLYGPLVARHEGANLEVNPRSTYTFKHSYFMVLNSNRNIISDSRKYGPIPDCDIVGVAYVY